MAQKATLVTADNKDQLTTRFYDLGSGVPIAIGYYLVAFFGEDGDYDMLSAAKFNELYEKGTPISNGFFEAIRRPGT
jgi:hypothetical protein